MADEITFPDKAKGTPVSVPTAPVAKPVAKVEAKPVRWKLAKGVKVMVPGLFEVSNAEINTPAVIKSITMHEARTGHRLFGVVFVKE
jgi:hypothetical protein